MSVIGLTNGHFGRFKRKDDKSFSRRRPAEGFTFHASLKYIASPPRCHRHYLHRAREFGIDSDVIAPVANTAITWSIIT